MGPYQLTKDILRADGVPGLFRGLTATFTREMPGYFFFFFAYDVPPTLSPLLPLPPYLPLSGLTATFTRKMPGFFFFFFALGR